MVKKIGMLANTDTNIIGNKYLELIQKIGARPVFIPYLDYTSEEVEEMVAGIDGLIVPGGMDVSPRTYKMSNSCSFGASHYYDNWQLVFISEAIDTKTKIFGICRGHQLLNVYFGGTLVQDIDNEFSEENTIEHNQNHGKFTRSELTHSIFMNNLKGKMPDFVHYKDGDYVNSFHHQAVTPDTLGKGLIPLFGTDCDVIEIMVHSSMNILSVQFHPEEFSEKDIKTTIKTLKEFFNYDNSTNVASIIKD